MEIPFRAGANTGKWLRWPDSFSHLLLFTSCANLLPGPSALARSERDAGGGYVVFREHMLIVDYKGRGPNPAALDGVAQRPHGATEQARSLSAGKQTDGSVHGCGAMRGQRGRCPSSWRDFNESLKR
jgi:hypothetical protein